MIEDEMIEGFHDFLILKSGIAILAGLFPEIADILRNLICARLGKFRKSFSDPEIGDCYTCPTISRDCRYFEKSDLRPIGQIQDSRSDFIFRVCYTCATFSRDSRYFEKSDLRPIGQMFAIHFIL
jgi:hypothetical protein